MGFRDWQAKHRDEHQFDCHAGNIFLMGREIIQTDTRRHKYPVAGATARFESAAAAQSRMTATRVVTGAVILGPLGAILGGMAKKNTTAMYIVVELADGTVLTDEAKAKDEAQIRAFVDSVNKAAEHWVTASV
jgi:hypothetical protein